MSDAYDEYHGPEDHDGPDDDWEDEVSCGSRRQRQCDLAGTEYCDWSCPLHNEVFPPRRSRR